MTAERKALTAAEEASNRVEVALVEAFDALDRRDRTGVDRALAKARQNAIWVLGWLDDADKARASGRTVGAVG